MVQHSIFLYISCISSPSFFAAAGSHYWPNPGSARCGLKMIKDEVNIKHTGLYGFLLCFCDVFLPLYISGNDPAFLMFFAVLKSS